MKKTVIATAVIIAATPLYIHITARLFENGLCRRYQLSPQEVRKAFAQYLTNAEHGMYGTYREAGSLETMYKALDEIVREQTASS